MTTWNQLPPVVTEGDPNHTAHHNLLRNAAEQLQAEVDAIAAGGGGGGGTGDVTQAELDAAVAPKADKTYVDAQDAALSTDIDGNTAAIGILQTNLNTKASATYVDAQDSALDTRIDALEAGGGGDASAVDWINVKASGLVKGDGTTDDTAAIQGVLDAAGVGATIYFPKGIYRVSAPLVPLRQQRLIGCHSPKYDPAEYPTTECAIRATSGFTGTGLFNYSSAPGVTIESLCLLGKGQTVSGGLNGIDMGVSTSGEKQWWIKSCSFSAFNGAAITGSMWVGDIRDCHIGRCGYGIKTNGAEGWTDVRIIGTQIYFCTNGGIEFDSTKRTGLVTIIGSRVERSGGTYGNPAVPLNTNAFGIRLGNVNNIELIGVSTDACSGPGLWIGTDVTDSSKIVYSVIVTGSEFLRDGGGDQTAGAALPGVRLRGASHVQFVGNTIGYGAHNDSNPGQVSPKFGLELEKATQCQIGYSRVETAVFADSLNIIGTQNYGTAINLQPHGLFSFPVANEAAQPAKPLTGSSYYSTTDQKPRWWTGSKWVDALNGDGTYAPTLKPGLDLEGPDTLYKSLRYKVGDLVRWVLSLRGSTGSSNFTLDRHDPAGAYVDTPLTVRASDGRIDTNPQYVTAKSPDKIAMEIRPAASPTVSWFKVADSAGVSALEVRYDGEVLVNGAPIAGGGGASPATVYTSDTEPTGGTYQVSDLWVSDPGGGAAPVLRGMWTGTDWGEPSAYPVDVTYTTDPGRPESVVRNDYVAAPENRDTYQVWSNGELTWWVNEWGGQRIRVAENSSWDAALRLIGASNQSGDYLEVQDSTRQVLLMRIKANGGIVAPNVQDPFVIAYGSDPIPTGAQKPCLVGRIGGTTTRYDLFDGPANGTPASGANGWDSVVGEPPVYSSIAAYSGHANGLVSNLNGDLSSYVVKKFPNGGYLNAGYARMRVRLPSYGDRNARVFSTEATTGGHRHPIRINTAGKVEITSYDGTTVLATSTTTLALSTWYDLGIKWDRGTTTANGSCEVRIYTAVGSDTPAETVTVAAGNFYGSGGDVWALRWGLQASNAGTNILHIGMIAWSPDEWPTSTPPEGTASLFLHDGTVEIPIGGGGGDVTKAYVDAADAALQASAESRWKRWTGSQAAYDAISPKDTDTLYVVV